MDDEEDLIGALPNWEKFRQPVSVDFLANVFRMSRDSVRKKLGSCKEIKPKKYDFVEAASFLAKPRYSIEEHMAVFKQGDLPPKLQAAYWDAMRKRQEWELRAGELWHTEKVIETFGEVFKRFKVTIQLFADTVDREHELTREQRAVLIRLSDGLLADLHADIRELSESRSTGPQADDIE